MNNYLQTLDRVIYSLMLEYKKKHIKISLLFFVSLESFFQSGAWALFVTIMLHVVSN